MQCRLLLGTILSTKIMKSKTHWLSAIRWVPKANQYHLIPISPEKFSYGGAND